MCFRTPTGRCMLNPTKSRNTLSGPRSKKKIVKICFSPRREGRFLRFQQVEKNCVFFFLIFGNVHCSMVFCWYSGQEAASDGLRRGPLAPPDAGCGSWALPGPPQGVPRGGLRSLRELCLKAFNNKSKRRGGRLWEAPGGSRKLRGAPRGSERLC